MGRNRRSPPCTSACGLVSLEEPSVGDIGATGATGEGVRSGGVGATGRGMSL